MEEKHTLKRSTFIKKYKMDKNILFKFILLLLILASCNQNNPSTPPVTTVQSMDVCTVCSIEYNGSKLANSLSASYYGSESDVTLWENEFKSNNSSNIYIPVCKRVTDLSNIVCVECYVVYNGGSTSPQTFTSYESDVIDWENTFKSNNSGIVSIMPFCKRKGFLLDNSCTECEVITGNTSTLNAQYVGSPAELTTWENLYISNNSVFNAQCYRKP